MVVSSLVFVLGGAWCGQEDTPVETEPEITLTSGAEITVPENAAANSVFGTVEVTATLNGQPVAVEFFIVSQTPEGALAIDQPIGDWTLATTGAINMPNMVRNAVAFNQPIGSWQMGSVTSMSGAFQSATSFDQSLANWNFGSVFTQGNFVATQE